MSYLEIQTNFIKALLYQPKQWMIVFYDLQEKDKFCSIVPLDNIK